MHVGAAIVFQNPGRAVPDRAMYKNELKLADLVEPLGFDSVWGIEHHFTDYVCSPDVTQFLTYMAGRTERVRLGSSVLVLPWHDPMWMAEKISLLDNLSDGRLILGLGRGAGKVEFDGFRVDMGESRERFIDYAKMVLEGLERGYCEHESQFVSQPRADIRPEPFKTFRGRTYASAVSPESSKIMAELGLGLLIIPQKPWEDVAIELDRYSTIFQEVNGRPAPQPIAFGWICCDEDEGRARAMAEQYIGGYYYTVLDHYKFADDHMKTTKGYEWYGKMAERLQKSGTDKAVEYFMNLQIWGTPEMCVEKIMAVRERVDACAFVGAFSYAGMPADQAERNMRLFADQVMPALQAYDAGAPIDRSAEFAEAAE